MDSAAPAMSSDPGHIEIDRSGTEPLIRISISHPPGPFTPDQLRQYAGYLNTIAEEAARIPGSFCCLCGNKSVAELGNITGICLDAGACRRRQAERLDSSGCYAADTCVLDPACPCVSTCRTAEQAQDDRNPA